MELKEILSISGAPGLYKYVAQGKGGIIVESLLDARRTMVSGTSKVSSLGDISMFTDSEEVSLGEIFQSIFDKNKGEIAVSNKSTNEELLAFMSEALPQYDRERVHISDIKKLATWYNLLVKAGMTDFKAKEEAAADENTPAIAAKPKAEAAPKKAVVKNASAPKASQPKIAAPKSTTNRKSGN